mgnify:CR=1 FL=1
MNKLISFAIAASLLGLLIWNPYPFKILELSTFDYLMSKSPTIQNENILRTVYFLHNIKHTVF